MTDALAALPRLSWRDIEVPVSGVRRASFSHEDVQHKFSYRDNEIVESTGARNWTFSYTIPFRQDIARGPYRDLYTVVLPQFILACRDRTPGELVDPELGLFIAKPTQLTSEIDVTKRDGSDISVEFVHSPDFDDVAFEIPGTLDGSGLQSQAGQLDAQIVVVDWEQQVPPEPLTDPLSALDSIGRQLEHGVNKFSNALDDAAFRMERLEATIDRLENPQVWPLKRSTRRLRDSTIRLKERATEDPLRKVITVTQRYASTVVAIAADAGMTVQELLRLNPGLAAAPMVEAGVTIRRFAA